MRVLIVSYAFLPSIGGVETHSLMLAQELQRRGHEVVVVTATACDAKPDFPFDVHYQPSAWRLLAAHRWADLVLHNSMSLRFAWPLLVFRRPWVIVHQGEMRPGGLRHWAVGRAANIAISQAVRDTVPGPAMVVPNAYRDSVFSCTNRGNRRYAFGFVGRLVSDKGCDNLLQALAILAREDLVPRCAVIGSGEEEAALKAQAQFLNVDPQVDFLGPKRDTELAAAMNEIDCLVVPSIWNEPFGIVALEGIACGCAVIGSQGGGLKDAIGPCGLTYPNGDVAALAAAMKRMLQEPDLAPALRGAAPEHLARHTPHAVVDAYLQVATREFQARLTK